MTASKTNKLKFYVGDVMKELLRLLFAFMRIGGFTFGGGYAMLPMLRRELVEKYRWATEEELMDYYAIAQCTPGAIAVNTATLVGYRVCGVWGGLVATLGVIFPSLVIITMIAALMQSFADIQAVQYAFIGIRACVCALILDSVIKLGKKAIVDVPTLVIAIVVLGMTCLTKFSPVMFVLLAAVAGICLQERRLRKQ